MTKNDVHTRSNSEMAPGFPRAMPLDRPVPTAGHHGFFHFGHCIVPLSTGQVLIKYSECEVYVLLADAGFASDGTLALMTPISDK